MLTLYQRGNRRSASPRPVLLVETLSVDIGPDLTGGVAVNLIPSDILDKEKFWSEELTAVNEKFLFGCSSFHGEEVIDQCGVVQGHAYTVVDAREVQGHRLVKIR